MQKTLTDQHSNRPAENKETRWWRQFLCKIIYGLWHQKKQTLENMGFPARPISQKEIFAEVERRVSMLKQEGVWGFTKEFPCWIEHNHNWIERRVNELAGSEFAPRTVEGVLKVVCVDKKRGLYAPNQDLFKKIKLM